MFLLPYITSLHIYGLCYTINMELICTCYTHEYHCIALYANIYLYHYIHRDDDKARSNYVHHCCSYGNIR